MSYSPSTKIPLPKACLLAALLPLFLLTPARAASIIWDPSGPQNVDLDNANSQVSSAGTFFAASTISATLTVGGVLFTNYLSSPHISIATESTGAYGDAGGTTYQQLLRFGSYVSPPTSGTPSVISGLIPGYTYQLQLWTTYWNVDYQTRFSSASGGATNLSPVVHLGVPSQYPGGPTVPQYILATFVADDTTQNLYRYSSNYYAMMGPMQVRLIAVPEPQTWALAAVGLSVVAFRLRRKFRPRELIA